MAVFTFVNQISELESEMSEAIMCYVDHYRAFCRLWKDILAEKKGLRSVVDELRKSEAVLASAIKAKVGPKGKYPDERTKQADIASRRKARDELAAGVTSKSLSLQKDLHEKMR